MCLAAHQRRVLSTLLPARCSAGTVAELVAMHNVQTGSSGFTLPALNFSMIFGMYRYPTGRRRSFSILIVSQPDVIRER